MRSAFRRQRARRENKQRSPAEARFVCVCLCEIEKQLAQQLSLPSFTQERCARSCASRQLYSTTWTPVASPGSAWSCHPPALERLPAAAAPHPHLLAARSPRLAATTATPTMAPPQPLPTTGPPSPGTWPGRQLGRRRTRRQGKERESVQLEARSPSTSPRPHRSQSSFHSIGRRHARRRPGGGLVRLRLRWRV